MSKVQRRFAVLISSVMAMVAMGAVASAAQAAFEIQDKATGKACSALSVEGNDVSGGCLIEEMAGTFTIMAGGSVFEVYDTYFDIRMDAQGKFYAVDQSVSPHYGGWYRQQCEDPVTHEPIPWQGSAAPMNMTMCLEGPAGQFYLEPTFTNTLDPVEGGYLFSRMTQNNNQSSGIAWADFFNYGGNEEILIVVW